MECDEQRHYGTNHRKAQSCCVKGTKAQDYEGSDLPNAGEIELLDSSAIIWDEL